MLFSGDLWISTFGLIQGYDSFERAERRKEKVEQESTGLAEVLYLGDLLSLVVESNFGIALTWCSQFSNVFFKAGRESCGFVGQSRWEGK